jgi:hypothetical protein
MIKKGVIVFYWGAFCGFIRVGGGGFGCFVCRFGRLRRSFSRFADNFGRFRRFFSRFDVCMIVGYLKETMPWQSLFFQPI